MSRWDHDTGDFGDASPRGFGSGGRTVRAQRSCDLTVERGEIVALLGPNGAGKSTLIDLVLGFTMSTTGTVEVFGTTPRAAIDAQRVGAVMQTGGLLPDLTVAMTLRTIAAFPTHYLEEAQNFARRIVMLDRGGTIADGTLRGTRGQRPRPHLNRGGRHTHRHRRGRRGVRRDGP